MASRTALVLPALAAAAMVVAVAAGCTSAPEVVPQSPTPSAVPEPSSSPEPPPTTVRPLPLARDGSDLNACRKGRCQVVISGATTLTVAGVTLTATPQDGGVTVVATDENGNQAQLAGPPGTSNTLGLSGHTIKVTVVAVAQNRAVLDLSS